MIKAILYGLDERASRMTLLGPAWFDQIPAVGTTIVYASKIPGNLPEEVGFRWLVSVVEQTPAIAVVGEPHQVCQLAIDVRPAPVSDRA